MWALIVGSFSNVSLVTWLCCPVTGLHDHARLTTLAIRWPGVAVMGVDILKILGGEGFQSEQLNLDWRCQGWAKVRIHKSTWKKRSWDTGVKLTISLINCLIDNWLIGLLIRKLVSSVLVYKASEVGPVHPKSSGFCWFVPISLSMRECRELVCLASRRRTSIGSREEFRA